MSSTPDDSNGLRLVITGSEGLQQAEERLTETIYGSITPRIHSKLSELPSKGQELIDFSAEIGLPLLPHQAWLAIQAHRIKPDGRWHHPLICAVQARQNGKTTLMMSRIL
ncbi:hypothetical protein UFOVP1406_21, partial [uncultured Caudovirales phage]